MDKDLQTQYNKLYGAYKDMATSKLVLAEKSISEILRQIAQNDGIYNLIAETVLGFNFDKELNASMHDGVLVLPNSNEKIIPLVFCILNEIDNGKISAITFITRTFNDSKEEGYNRFCSEIIEPFILAIKDSLGAEDVVEETACDDGSFIEELFTSELVDRMKYITKEVSDKLNELKKCDLVSKNAANTICFSIDLCLAELQFIGVFGLFSGLKMALLNLKKFKNEIKEIDLLLNILNEMN